MMMLEGPLATYGKEDRGTIVADDKTTNVKYAIRKTATIGNISRLFTLSSYWSKEVKLS